VPATEPRIVYTPRADATPEGELNTLATVYAFILQRHHERQKASCSGGLDDNAMESERRWLCQTKI
jgi:hypothetical protein